MLEHRADFDRELLFAVATVRADRTVRPNDLLKGIAIFRVPKREI